MKDINVTLGGCAFWHAVISIKKSPGEGKNALLAALSVMDLKHVVVVDDDIDINDPADVEWAIATRVRHDHHIAVAPFHVGRIVDVDVVIDHDDVFQIHHRQRGKNALLAALSVMDLKHVVVADDDIDINDPAEWAIATRACRATAM